MNTVLAEILGYTRVIVREDERALHLDRGQLKGVLTPGEHWLASRSGRLAIERHSLAKPVLSTTYEKAFRDRLPKDYARHLSVFTTGPGEVAVIFRDGHVHSVVGPDSRQPYWTDAGPWSAETFGVAEAIDLDPVLARRIANAVGATMHTSFTVAEGHVGLLYVDSVFRRTLSPGIHAFWTAVRSVNVKMVDLRTQSLDVSGQELLTKDRVTIRVNLSADFRIADPVLAATATKDFADAFYRALQQAFRKALGAMTLDQILAEKATVDVDATAKVTADMAAIGIDVLSITLKDVILPGDMREILNKVVAAEKEAEANVIRRREETNATRSLLNTAKVMAENPVMLRLKELEALEAIAAKVERITVHNGTDGLINDLVRLRER